MLSLLSYTTSIHVFKKVFMHKTAKRAYINIISLLTRILHLVDLKGVLKITLYISYHFHVVAVVAF